MKLLINQNIKKNNLNIFNFEIVNTEDIISDEDNVNTILRSKKNSSIYKGLEFAKKIMRNQVLYHLEVLLLLWFFQDFIWE